MGVVALNAYEKMVALNAYGNAGSERLWKWWWLCTPMEMVALNAYENGGGFKHL